MEPNNLWKSLFANWEKRGFKIPEDATPDEKRAWEGLLDVERFRSEVAALGEFDDFERELYRGLDPWQYYFVIGGELKVERIVFDFLEAKGSGADLPVWPSEAQVEAMRRGLVEIDRLAVRGELESYRTELRTIFERTLDKSEIEGNKGWIKALSRTIKNLNFGNAKVRAETDRLARLVFGFRPKKNGTHAWVDDFPKNKRPAMEMMEDEIPVFSPRQGRPGVTLSWETEKRQAEINQVRLFIMRDSLSQREATTKVAEQSGADKAKSRAKDIAKIFRKKMSLRH